MVDDSPVGSSDVLPGYLAECRDLVLDELKTFIPRDPRLGPVLYDLMYEYPLREAKALRPALCIATCRALGGPLHGVLRSAAVIELYHNAFLIHDDVEDQSHKRRDAPTLHLKHGLPVAVNVGDAMLALAIDPLLDNTRLLGLGKALQVLRLVATMARESAEGQAIELAWTRAGRWELPDTDYLRMVHKKTSWYTFLAPVAIGAVVAEASARDVRSLNRFAIALGAAFQIQDDILNLVAREERYGKEIEGDLWEGKHTLILLHAIRSATPAEREKALEVLGKARPGAGDSLETLSEHRKLIASLASTGEITPNAEELLSASLFASRRAVAFKTRDDVAMLAELIRKYRSVDYASGLARRRAERARRSLCVVDSRLIPSVHLEFLHGLVDFVVDRDR